VYLMLGILGARSVQTGRLAAYIPVAVKTQSLVRRMERFLGNGAVNVRVWYGPVARQLLQAASVAGEVQRVFDTTKVSAHHRLLMVGLAYRRRVLPLAWTWVRSSRGHSSRAKQLAVLSYVRSLLPDGVKVSLVGDCEFGHPLVLETLTAWHWAYVLRPSGQLLVWSEAHQDWLRLDSLLTRRGDYRCLGSVTLTVSRQVPTHLLLAWARRYPTPGLWATNLTRPFEMLRRYHRRLWIEKMLGDLKGNGFDLERSAVRHFLRLSRLTLAVALWYVWLIAFGAELVQNGLHTQVDRTDRRDLSLFRMAWDYLQRALLCYWPFSVTFEPFFGPLPHFHPCGF
jgi:hypothetical protein